MGLVYVHSGKYRDWYPSSHNHGSVENDPNLYTKQVLGEPVSNFHDYGRVYVHSGTSSTLTLWFACWMLAKRSKNILPNGGMIVIYHGTT